MDKVPTLRPMGLLEIVDQTFRLYRQHFWLFFGIAGVLYLPLGLLQGLLPKEISWVFALGMLPAYALVGGALTKAVSDRYMGDRATLGGSYAFIWKRFGAYLLTSILAYLFIFSGLFLLLVGAIFFALWMAFVSQAFVIEGKAYVEALKRSKSLGAKNNWDNIFLLGLIVTILTGVISGVAMLLSGLLPPVARELVEGIGQSLVAPISIVAFILLYYDTRIRKEGFDLEVLARELGKEIPAAAGPAASPATSAAPLPGPPASPPPPNEGAV